MPALHRIPADQNNPMFGKHREKTSHELSQPLAPKSRSQGQGKQGETRQAAHGRDIADIDRSRLPAKFSGGMPTQIKMNPFHHGIRGDQTEPVRGGFVYRAVIADPDDKIAGNSRRLTDAGDDLSFSWMRHAYH